MPQIKLFVCLLVIAGAATATLVTAGASLADPVQPRDYATVVDTDGAGLNLRAGPGAGQRRLLKIPEGARVYVRGDAVTANGYRWYPVAYGGRNGWVVSRWLRSGSAAQSGEGASASRVNVVTAPRETNGGQLALKWPFRPGAEWLTLQGYQGGTHEGYERYSLDLAREDGRQRGEPVLAAADGTFAWDTRNRSGCVGIRHEGNVYTEYCHMTDIPAFQRGQAIRQGQRIGSTGSQGAENVAPHIHFTLYRQDSGSAGRGGRQALPFLNLGGRSYPANDSVRNQWGNLRNLISTNTPR